MSGGAAWDSSLTSCGHSIVWSDLKLPIIGLILTCTRWQVLLRNARRHLAGEKAQQEVAAPKQRGLMRDPDLEYYNQVLYVCTRHHSDQHCSSRRGVAEGRQLRVHSIISVS